MTPSKPSRKARVKEAAKSPEDLTNGFAQTLGRLIAAEILDDLGMHKEAREVLRKCGRRPSSTT